MGTLKKCEFSQKPVELPQDPVKQTTDEFYTTCNLPARWQRPYWFSGYGSQQNPLPHPFYRSTYMDIGWYPPSVHTVPVSYFPTQQKFSNHLASCGMYRNSSLNTSLDPQPWGTAKHFIIITAKVIFVNCKKNFDKLTSRIECYIF